jgi:hypothetical protein
MEKALYTLAASIVVGSLVAGFLIGGVYKIEGNGGGMVWRVNSFTGATSMCMPNTNHDSPGFRTVVCMEDSHLGF